MRGKEKSVGCGRVLFYCGVLLYSFNRVACLAFLILLQGKKKKESCVHRVCNSNSKVHAATNPYHSLLPLLPNTMIIMTTTSTVAAHMAGGPTPNNNASSYLSLRNNTYILIHVIFRFIIIILVILIIIFLKIIFRTAEIGE